MERRSPRLKTTSPKSKTTIFSLERFYLDAGIIVLDRALREVLPKRPAVVPLILVSPDQRSVKATLHNSDNVLFSPELKRFFSRFPTSILQATILPGPDLVLQISQPVPLLKTSVPRSAHAAKEPAGLPERKPRTARGGPARQPGHKVPAGANKPRRRQPDAAKPADVAATGAVSRAAAGAASVAAVGAAAEAASVAAVGAAAEAASVAAVGAAAEAASVAAAEAASVAAAEAASMAAVVAPRSPAPVLPLPAIQFLDKAWPEIETALSGRKFAGPLEEYVHQRAAVLGANPGFDTLLSLNVVKKILPFDYQLKAVREVLQKMRGRALLCDEVGLGKTIEAGLVVTEYLMRGLARRVLVLCPSPLVEQWAEELHAKFNLDFVVFDDPKFQQDPSPWSSFDRIVASLDTVKREPHRSAVLASFFECVIVDEAHRCRNRSTLNWTFVSELKKKYILLLTATPIQNSLEELYNLITLLRPGQLETPSAFARKYISSGDRLKPRNVEQLRTLTREVMIRNKRSSCGVPLPKRRADTISVRLTPGEASLYREITGYVRREYLLHQRSASMQMVLKTLQREIGSSVQAVAPTLARLAANAADPAAQKQFHELHAAAQELRDSSKAEALIRLIQALNGEKAIVFTSFRRTQELLAGMFQSAGIEFCQFHGEMRRQEKEEAIQRFAERAPVLLSTESGGEGRNLQFCRVMINFDLPWNPMRIEQRIGRIHRIGQTKDVHIFNLSAADTIGNKRSSCGVPLPKRRADTISVRLTPGEASLYREITGYVRREYLLHQRSASMQMVLKTLQREIGSSVQAVAPTLARLAANAADPAAQKQFHELHAAAQELRDSSKAEALIRLIQALNGEKAIVFTSFRRTQELLAGMFQSAGIEFCQFHGEMRRQEKEEAIQRFAERAPVLLSTESGGEGRNLQFCRVMINFDLPWNPMRIEQRIGRIHRIGQTKDVHIFNLSAADTIEAHLLTLLDSKINLFELVVGELDMILGELSDERDFEDLLMDIWAGSRTDAELEARLAELGEALAQSKERYNTARQHDEALFG
ncbi:MAG: DEAD/DEAH box helicase [Firmicutes bacterium]|nr:DEAD/DEAH box helicase [Bacillota bacterium]